MQSIGPLDYAPARFNWRRFFWTIGKILCLVALLALCFWGLRWVWLRYRFLRQQEQALTYSPLPTELAYEDAVYPEGWAFWRTAPRVPEFWMNYPAWGGSYHPLLFLHERTAPTGEHRLVIVCMQIDNYSDHREYIIGKGATIPGSWRHDAQGSLHFFSSVPNSTLPKGIKFFAGQPHPTDASLFQIKYEVDGVSGVVEGRLDPGGATLSFTGWP